MFVDPEIWVRTTCVHRDAENSFIGERSEPPLSVELSEFSLYLYICWAQSMDCRAKYGSMVCVAQSMDCANPCFAPNIYIKFYIFQVVRRARAVNALRANVGPAG